MWTKTSVNRVLEAYAEDKARVEHLSVEIDNLAKAVQYFELNIHQIVDPLKAQQITGMPHGSGTSDSTAMTAIRLASGWVPSDIRDLKNELAELEREFELKKANVAYVEAWMVGLSDREAWLIRKQVINKEYWRDVIDDYARDFQIRVSQDSLGRIKAKALRKIYQAAGAVEQGA